MHESTMLVTATLPEGGSQSYKIALVRDGLGWKVATVDLEYSSLDGTATVGSEGGVAAEGSEARSQTSDQGAPADGQAQDGGEATTADAN